MRNIVSLIILFVSTMSLAQQGSTVLTQSSTCSSAISAGSECFQIGSTWNKLELATKDDLSKIPAHLHPAIKGTAQFILGGSGVLLGQFNNQWVVATSFHMCQQNFGGACPPMALNGELRLLGISFQAEEVIGTWPAVDLLLFTVSFKQSDVSQLAGVGQSFDFQTPLTSGSLLAVSGYTLIKGFSGNLQFTGDSDCRILSKSGESRLISDPDTVKPDTEKKWAFAMGCDVARGDSGGPVLDRTTGKVLGLVWTGKTPTAELVKNSSSLEAMREKQDTKIWSNVSYSSPAAKISEFLKQSLDDPEMAESHRSILRAMLQ